MAPQATDKKRKASSAAAATAAAAAAESDSEGSLDGLLEGVFSDSSDEEEDEDDVFDADQGDDDDDDLGSEDNGLSEDDESDELAKLTLDGTEGAVDDEDDEGEEEDEEEENERQNYRVTTDANGGVRYLYDEVDPVYDSDDSAPEVANTIGNIPLSFYESYPHIGYDINGKKIMRPATGEALDALLDSIELPKGWTGLTDPATGKPLRLSQDELELLRRVHANEVPEEGYDPYPDMVEYFTRHEEPMPLSAAPEPKRRFVPSKHEAIRVAKLVRAIREGRILPHRPRAADGEGEDGEGEDDGAPRYDLWKDEVPQEPHVMHIPAPKLPPPGHAESYNCPPEYVPSKAERAAWEAADPEEREAPFLPTKHDALRKVPGYGDFVKERFERCLDLYLAPRVRRNRLHIDPAALLPKLPPAEELKPFPTVCQTVFRGHVGWVRCVAIDPTGQWLASGGNDGTVRLWELLTGRQVWSARLSQGRGHGGSSNNDDRLVNDEPVHCVAWRPGRGACVLAAAAGEDLFFIVPTAAVDPELEQASRAVVDNGFGYAAGKKTEAAAAGTTAPSAAKWTRPDDARLAKAGVLVQVRVRAAIRSVSWHRRGDYVATVAPAGGRSAVALHTLSRHRTQTPFRRLANIPQAAHFHPSRPLFFVATKQRIRVYDLQKMELVRTVLPGARLISSFDVHPTAGEHLIVGGYDRRLVWQDVELAATPFRTMRYHDRAVRAVRFHRGGLPLFADTSDDGTLQIYFGRVYNDPMAYPTLVPLKKLERGAHKVVDAVGALDVTWHPQEAWCVSAGADGTCRLWM